MKPLYLLVIASAISQIAFMVAQFTLLLYALHLQFSPTVAGLLVSLGGIGPALIAVSIGKFIDRQGARATMTIALICQVAGALLPIAWHELPALFLASFINGTSFIVFRVGSQHTVGRMGRADDRTTHYSLLGLGYSVSSIVGPLSAGYAIDHVGHLPTFAYAAACPLITLLCIATGLVQFPTPQTQPVSATPHEGLFVLLRDARLRRVMITTVIINGAWDVFLFLAPLYGSQLRLSASQIGLIASTLAGGCLCVRAMAPRLLRRWSNWQVLIAALVTGGMSFLTYPALPTLALLLAVAFIAGMAMGVALPVTMALAFDASPVERTGEVIGLRLALSMAGATLLPLVCGALGTAVGLAPVYLIEGAALLSGAWYNRRQWRGARA